MRMQSLIDLVGLDLAEIAAVVPCVNAGPLRSQFLFPLSERMNAGL
jgi:hypothetical protein